MANTRDSIGDQAALDGLINHTLTSFEDDAVTSLRSYAIYNNPAIKSISLPSVKSAGDYAFGYCTNLESVQINDMADAGSHLFTECNKLNSLSIDSLTTIKANTFERCHSLNDIDLTNVTRILSDVFAYSGVGQLILPSIETFNSYVSRNSRISIVDIGLNFNNFTSYSFSNSYSLCHLIIRSTTMINLNSTNVFNNTPISQGIGWIYVPSNLVDTYKSATNWSQFSSQIVSIDEYPKALQNETITDSWSDIIAAANNGTHSKYNVGDIKYCNIGGTYVPMQIVALNTDSLSGGGTAPITFISLGAFDIEPINFEETNTGGWANCMLRGFLSDTIFPQIEDTVRNAIRSVVKTYRNPTTYNTQSTTDKIWIPSYRELFGDTTFEDYGVVYDSCVNGGVNYRKKYLGVLNTSSNQSNWWLRTAPRNTGYFEYINTSGAAKNTGASSNQGVVIGFCI